MDNYNKVKYIYDCIGMITDELCPECNESYIIRDAHGVEWCYGEDCIWTNDEGLQELIRIMKKDEDNRQILGGEENNQ